MNFIQRNPSDPKHGEFHDGEYEYWPMDDSIKTKSISIPAALISGLELLAAAAAAALLAVALSALYVLSSPLAISENSAVINTNIYNNHDDLGVVYTLSSLETPDNVLQDGILLHDEQTLSLQNLDGGTTYLLKYYDSEQNEIGQFWFTTSGEKPVPEEPEPPAPAQPPEESSEESASEPETSAETDETTESTTESTAETVVPDERPPVIVRPRPTPRPDPEEEEDYTPDPVPEPTPEVVPAPKPASGPPDIGNLSYGNYISGDFNDGDLRFTEYFVFTNVPDANYEIHIVQNGTTITDYSGVEYSDGTLTIPVEGLINFGERVTTTVTIYTSAGNTSKESVIAAPKLSSADLNVKRNPDGTYTFTITATVAMKDGTDFIDEMNLTATLNPYIYNNNEKETVVEELPMKQVDGNRSQYTTEPYTISVPDDCIKTAVASVSGHWYRIDEHTYPQSVTTTLDYATVSADSD